LRSCALAPQSAADSTYAASTITCFIRFDPKAPKQVHSRANEKFRYRGGYQPALFSESSAKCERDQAGAKQQQPDNGQDKETERRKIFTH
jgi:hypothetical protein